MVLLLTEHPAHVWIEQVVREKTEAGKEGDGQREEEGWREGEREGRGSLGNVCVQPFSQSPICGQRDADTASPLPDPTQKAPCSAARYG